MGRSTCPKLELVYQLLGFSPQEELAKRQILDHQVHHGKTTTYLLNTLYQYFIIVTRYLVDTLWFSHGGLDGQGFDVLPVLLEERNQEVDGQVQVLDKLIFRHVNITNSNIEAKDLFHLELDGGLDIIDFTKHIILMGQHSWEFTSLVQTWTQKTWDLFDQGFRSEESIILLGKLLDQFLVLVELLEVISGHVWDTL